MVQYPVAPHATALISAAQNGHADCVEALLKGGANVHAKDKDGDSALHSAAWKGHVDCCRLLLRAGADPTVGPKGCPPPLRVAEQKGHAAVAARRGARRTR